jgi:two-component system chemotaxis response regulator CheB
MSTTRHKESSRRPFDVVVVVGSQGALDSFQIVLEALPADFPAAVIFDLHRSESYGLLEEVLRRRGALRVTSASEGLRLDAGTVYVAPHDRQLVITADGRLAVLGPGDGFGHRFADELLLSAATAHGPAVIAVTLSGRLDGGVRGVREVKRRGGRVLVQDPETAAATGMPNAALASGCADFVLAPASLGHALLALCAAPGAAELFRVRLNPTVIS